MVDTRAEAQPPERDDGPLDTAGPREAAVRLVVVDEDPGFVRVLANRAEMRGWEVRCVEPEVALEAVGAADVDAVVLDLALLDRVAGGSLEAIVRLRPALPIIVCTGPSSVADRVRGLRAGAAAWLTKPCHPEELIGVVEAALRGNRRPGIPPGAHALRLGELVIRHDLRQAFVGERSLELTVREFDLLSTLVQADRILGREEIYELVWGYQFLRGDRSVDVFIRKVRLKLRDASPGWSYIHTHFRVGYGFEPVRVATPVRSRAARGRPRRLAQSQAA